MRAGQEVGVRLPPVWVDLDGQTCRFEVYWREFWSLERIIAISVLVLRVNVQTKIGFESFRDGFPEDQRSFFAFRTDCINGFTFLCIRLQKASKYSLRKPFLEIILELQALL